MRLFRDLVHFTCYLLEKGIDKILKKVGEEATEVVIAAKNPNPEEIKYELSDFLYHAMVKQSIVIAVNGQSLNILVMSACLALYP